MENQAETVKQPKKRVSPIVLPKVEDVSMASKNKAAAKSTASKTTTSKTAASKTTTSKAATSKTTTAKTETKTSATAKKAEGKKEAPTKSSAAKTTTTKATTKATTSKAAATKKSNKSKIDVTKITSVKIDPRTGMVKQKPEKKAKPEEKTPVVPVEDTPKKKAPKPKKPSIKSKEVTIEPPVRDTTPKEIVRPTPKKAKQWNKEEKVLYKKLEESFNTVANMATVIEERTMDTKNIPDLTIGELHVIEMVNLNNNKPMTLIAKKMHVTVGSLTIAVNRLVQKGYLLRIRDEMDHRVILLSVTQQGKKVLKFHDKFHDDVLGIVLDTIPLQQAVKVMSQLAYVLELYYDPSIQEQEEKKTAKKGR